MCNSCELYGEGINLFSFFNEGCPEVACVYVGLIPTASFIVVLHAYLWCGVIPRVGGDEIEPET